MYVCVRRDANKILNWEKKYMKCTSERNYLMQNKYKIQVSLANQITPHKQPQRIIMKYVV